MSTIPNVPSTNVPQIVATHISDGKTQIRITKDEDGTWTITAD
jgi:hypothetical protein